jgi:GNAT superfamily N-acetyltransferase
MPVWKIRKATKDDIDLLTRFNIMLAQESEGSILSQEIVGKGVRAVFDSSDKGIYFAAENSDGKVVGSLMITKEWSDWRNGYYWWIQSVYVQNEFRRHGVFRALYEYVRNMARSEGAYSLKLYMEADNFRAQQTYTSMGMHEKHKKIFEDVL